MKPSAIRRRGVIVAGPFTPASLSPAVWYDPSDIASMFQTTDTSTPAVVDSPVGRINDKSGNNRHATQATAGARPILRQSGAEFYLEFDGVDDFLRATFTITQPYDRVSAIQQTTWTSLDRVFGGGSAAFSDLVQFGGTPFLQMEFDATDPPKSSAATLGTSFVITERRDGAGGGELAVDNNAYDVGLCPTTGPGGITIGATNAGARFGNVRVYGVVMVPRAMTGTEIADLRTWLGDKIGKVL